MFVDRVMFRILVAIVNHAHEPHQEGASINHADKNFTTEKGTLGKNEHEFSNMVTIKFLKNQEVK